MKALDKTRQRDNNSKPKKSVSQSKPALDVQSDKSNDFDFSSLLAVVSSTALNAPSLSSLLDRVGGCLRALLSEASSSRQNQPFLRACNSLLGAYIFKADQTETEQGVGGSKTISDENLKSVGLEGALLDSVIKPHLLDLLACVDRAALKLTLSLEDRLLLYTFYNNAVYGLCRYRLEEEAYTQGEKICKSLERELLTQEVVRTQVGLAGIQKYWPELSSTRQVAPHPEQVSQLTSILLGLYANIFLSLASKEGSKGQQQIWILKKGYLLADRLAKNQDIKSKFKNMLRMLMNSPCFSSICNLYARNLSSVPSKSKPSSVDKTIKITRRKDNYSSKELLGSFNMNDRKQSQNNLRKPTETETPLNNGMADTLGTNPRDRIIQRLQEEKNRSKTLGTLRKAPKRNLDLDHSHDSSDSEDLKKACKMAGLPEDSYSKQVSLFKEGTQPAPIGVNLGFSQTLLDRSKGKHKGANTAMQRLKIFAQGASYYQPFLEKLNTKNEDSLKIRRPSSYMKSQKQQRLISPARESGLIEEKREDLDPLAKTRITGFPSNPMPKNIRIKLKSRQTSKDVLEPSRQSSVKIVFDKSQSRLNRSLSKKAIIKKDPSIVEKMQKSKSRLSRHKFIEIASNKDDSSQSQETRKEDINSSEEKNKRKEDHTWKFIDKFSRPNSSKKESNEKSEGNFRGLQKSQDIRSSKTSQISGSERIPEIDISRGIKRPSKSSFRSKSSIKSQNQAKKSAIDPMLVSDLSQEPYLRQPKTESEEKKESVKEGLKTDRSKSKEEIEQRSDNGPLTNSPKNIFLVESYPSPKIAENICYKNVPNSPHQASDQQSFRPNQKNTESSKDESEDQEELKPPKETPKPSESNLKVDEPNFKESQISSRPPSRNLPLNLTLEVVDRESSPDSPQAKKTSLQALSVMSSGDEAEAKIPHLIQTPPRRESPMEAVKRKKTLRLHLNDTESWHPPSNKVKGAGNVHQEGQEDKNSSYSGLGAPNALNNTTQTNSALSPSILNKTNLGGRSPPSKRINSSHMFQFSQHAQAASEWIAEERAGNFTNVIKSNQIQTTVLQEIEETKQDEETNFSPSKVLQKVVNSNDPSLKNENKANIIDNLEKPELVKLVGTLLEQMEEMKKQVYMNKRETSPTCQIRKSKALTLVPLRADNENSDKDHSSGPMNPSQLDDPPSRLSIDGKGLKNPDLTPKRAMLQFQTPLQDHTMGQTQHSPGEYVSSPANQDPELSMVTGMNKRPSNYINEDSLLVNQSYHQGFAGMSGKQSSPLAHHHSASFQAHPEAFRALEKYGHPSNNRLGAQIEQTPTQLNPPLQRVGEKRNTSQYTSLSPSPNNSFNNLQASGQHSMNYKLNTSSHQNMSMNLYNRMNSPMSRIVGSQGINSTGPGASSFSRVINNHQPEGSHFQVLQPSSQFGLLAQGRQKSQEATGFNEKRLSRQAIDSVSSPGLPFDRQRMMALNITADGSLASPSHGSRGKDRKQFFGKIRTVVGAAIKLKGFTKGRSSQALPPLLAGLAKQSSQVLPSPNGQNQRERMYSIDRPNGDPVCSASSSSQGGASVSPKREKPPPSAFKPGGPPEKTYTGEKAPEKTRTSTAYSVCTSGIKLNKEHMKTAGLKYGGSVQVVRTHLIEEESTDILCSGLKVKFRPNSPKSEFFFELSTWINSSQNTASSSLLSSMKTDSFVWTEKHFFQQLKTLDGHYVDIYPNYVSANELIEVLISKFLINFVSLQIDTETNKISPVVGPLPFITFKLENLKIFSSKNSYSACLIHREDLRFWLVVTDPIENKVKHRVEISFSREAYFQYFIDSPLTSDHLKQELIISSSLEKVRNPDKNLNQSKLKNLKYCVSSVYVKKDTNFPKLFREVVEDFFSIYRAHLSQHKKERNLCESFLKITKPDFKEYVVMNSRDYPSEQKVSIKVFVRFSSASRYLNQPFSYQPCFEQDIDYSYFKENYAINARKWNKQNRNYHLNHLFALLDISVREKIVEKQNESPKEKSPHDSNIALQSVNMAEQVEASTSVSLRQPYKHAFFKKFLSKDGYKVPLIIELVGDKIGNPREPATVEDLLWGIKFCIFDPDFCKHHTAYIPVTECQGQTLVPQTTSSGYMALFKEAFPGICKRHLQITPSFKFYARPDRESKLLYPFGDLLEVNSTLLIAWVVNATTQAALQRQLSVPNSSLSGTPSHLGGRTPAEPESSK